MEENDAFGRAINREMAQTPGFISLVIAGQGRRQVLVSAWERPGDSRRVLHEGTHREATKRYLQDSFRASEMSSEWTPMFLHWRVPCPDCGRKVKYDDAAPVCACGTALGPPPVYW